MRARKTVRLWFSRYLYLGAATWLLFALPAEAAGTNQEAVKKVIALNKEARQFFDAMEFTLAEKSLKKALEIGEEAGLGPHVVMAGTHGNLGVLYATGIKDEAQALFQFKKALELRPASRSPPSRATVPPNPESVARVENLASAHLTRHPDRVPPRFHPDASPAS